MAITQTPVPISNLGAATTPLVGDELVPLVQGGVTKQAPASAFGGSNGAIVWGGLAQANLSAGQNDNLNVDLSSAARLELTPAGDADLTGLDGGEDGKLVHIVNVDAANVITILVESLGSDAENRFANNGDLILPPFCGALFIYYSSIQRWVKV